MQGNREVMLRQLCEAASSAPNRYEETYQQPWPHQRSVDATSTRRHHRPDHECDRGNVIPGLATVAPCQSHEQGDGERDNSPEFSAKKG